MYKECASVFAKALAESPRQRLMDISESDKFSDEASRDAALHAESERIEIEAKELMAMSYEALVARQKDWLCAPPIHPTGGRWGADWEPKVAAALRDRPIRKRYVLAGNVRAVNIGRVVGCVDHWFEVLYVDEFHEKLSWHELRQAIVPNKRDAELRELEEAGYESVCRASRREHKLRDKQSEADAYLPRLGCHCSLPPGKVACHLHEALRLSGLVVGDPGPLASD